MSEEQEFGMLMAEDSESEANRLLIYRINSLIVEINHYKNALEYIAGWNHQLFDEHTAMQMRNKAEQTLEIYESNRKTSNMDI